MKKLKYLIPSIFAGIGLISILLTSSSATTYIPMVINNCVAPLSWLYEKTVPEPDYENFPCGYTVSFDGSATNAAFHEISYQYFLWLMEPVCDQCSSELRFETLYNDAAINPDETNPKEHILGGVVQAGSESILVDNHDRAVYTSMMINDIYRDFVIENKLYTTNGLEGISDTVNFPSGAMSIKASWKIIGQNEKPPQGAYTRTSKLYKLVNKDGIVTTSDNTNNETITEKVALVGFHIAVVVEGHPEFIWATFELNGNAPNYFRDIPNASSGSQDTLALSNDYSYSFYKKGTIVNDCNKGNRDIIRVDESSQKIEFNNNSRKDPSTNVFLARQFGQGVNSNQNNINILNKKVHSELSHCSIARNYTEIGATWFNQKDALKPNWSVTVDEAIVTGSLMLSNSTIETFTQDINDQNSCFDCHNTRQVNNANGSILKGKNVLTSHILLKNYIELTNGSQLSKPVQRK